MIPNSGANNPKHSLMTRIAHMGLALVIILQLLTSLVMQGPGRTQPGDFLFQLHQYGGLTALFFTFLFWMSVMLRRRGTPLMQLIPWFSVTRRNAFWQDACIYYEALKNFQLPDYNESAPFASAVHGLGLLLMSLMAITGTVFYVMASLGMATTLPAELLLGVHTTFGNLVWAYLIGHAGFALLHHYADDLGILNIGSLHKS